MCTGQDKLVVKMNHLLEMEVGKMLQASALHEFLDLMYKRGGLNSDELSILKDSVKKGGQLYRFEQAMFRVVSNYEGELYRFR